MRTLIREGLGFRVPDDPDGVLGDFLGFATSPPEDGRPVEGKLEKGGGGVAWADLMGACLCEDPELLASYAPPLREPWLVNRYFPGRGAATLLIEGDELRDLVRQAWRIMGAS